MEGRKTEEYLIEIRDKVVKIEISQTVMREDVTEIKVKMMEVEKKTENIYIETTSTKKDVSYLDRRVSELEDTNKWLFRLIAGSLIVSALSMVGHFIRAK